MNDYAKQMETELESLRRDEQDSQHFSNPMQSLYQQDGDENIAKWQLDLSEDLDRIYHLLQGHSLGSDEKGNIIYVEPKDYNQKPFNEYGVQQIMNILSFYLNRNTILSNYKDDVINKKVYNFGVELTDLIHNKYQDMMTTISVEDVLRELTGTEPVRLPDGRYVARVDKFYENGVLKIKIIYYDDMIMEYIHEVLRNSIAEKIKLYPMIVRALVDTVHSAYLRAYNGGERDSLRKSMNLSANLDNSNNMPGMNGSYQQPKQRKWYNPMSWSG